ncbi:MAG: metallophosphoesterase [Lachnospiraceae bacterium]|nr:metallophosphoesterase [Lachnospiraceae bacterium]
MNIFLTSCFAGGVLTLLYGMLETKLLSVKEYKINSERVPESLSGKKIALISDIHGISHGKDNSRLFERLKEIEPDYIVICGDLVNGRGAKELKFAFRFIRKIKKLRIPVLYTFGNHEEKLRKHHRKACRRLLRFARKRIILLNNRAYKTADGETVFVGLNLPLWMYHGHDTKGIIKKRTDKILSKVNAENCYKILIAHDPEHLKEYSESGYDVCLSGHLHGGIIYVPFLGGTVTPRFQIFHKRVRGIHECGNMKMVISRGVGWHDVPIRIFNRPEIVVVKFEKEGSGSVQK